MPGSGDKDSIFHRGPGYGPGSLDPYLPIPKGPFQCFRMGSVMWKICLLYTKQMNTPAYSERLRDIKTSQEQIRHTRMRSLGVTDNRKGITGPTKADRIGVNME